MLFNSIGVVEPACLSWEVLNTVNVSSTYDRSNVHDTILNY